MEDSANQASQSERKSGSLNLTSLIRDKRMTSDAVSRINLRSRDFFSSGCGGRSDMPRKCRTLQVLSPTVWGMNANPKYYFLSY